MRNVILVHGFWHGSWCWSLVTEELAAHGIPSIAVDLDGHGLKSRFPESHWVRPFDPATFATETSPLASTTSSSAAQTLVEQIRRIGGGEPCVVVAHSMGGTVATLASELAPELFAHLIYVSALVPVAGLPAAAYVTMPENAGETISGLLIGNPFSTGALRQDTLGRSRHPEVREAFYNDLDEATADAAIALLSPDGPAGIPGEAFTVSKERYGSVPHTYVVCTRDNTVRPALQRRFADEIGQISSTPVEVVELDSSHSPFLSRPAELAEVIAAAWS